MHQRTPSFSLESEGSRALQFDPPMRGKARIQVWHEQSSVSFLPVISHQTVQFLEGVTTLGHPKNGGDFIPRVVKPNGLRLQTPLQCGVRRIRPTKFT